MEAITESKGKPGGQRNFVYKKKGGGGLPAIQSFDQTDESGSGNEANEKKYKAKQSSKSGRREKGIQLSSWEDVINGETPYKKTSGPLFITELHIYVEFRAFTLGGVEPLALFYTLSCCRHFCRGLAPGLVCCRTVLNGDRGYGLLNGTICLRYWGNEVNTSLLDFWLGWNRANSIELTIWLLQDYIGGDIDDQYLWVVYQMITDVDISFSCDCIVSLSCWNFVIY